MKSKVTFPVLVDVWQGPLSKLVVQDWIAARMWCYLVHSLLCSHWLCLVCFQETPRHSAQRYHFLGPHWLCLVVYAIVCLWCREIKISNGYFNVEKLYKFQFLAFISIFLINLFAVLSMLVVIRTRGRTSSSPKKQKILFRPCIHTLSTKLTKKKKNQLFFPTPSQQPKRN